MSFADRLTVFSLSFYRFSGDTKALLLSILSKKTHIHIKYASYEFKCRMIQRYLDKHDAVAAVAGEQEEVVGVVDDV